MYYAVTLTWGALYKDRVRAFGLKSHRWLAVSAPLIFVLS